ncbi:MAG: rod shape-determining protein MreC [Myxococcota bacterium]|nr:rod shape-determining protein MreC [Myxococcota bacterium]
MSAPIVLGALILMALVSIVGDRKGPERGDLPWWQGVLLEISAPFQKAVGMPADLAASTWHSYIDLVDLRAENDEMRADLLELEETNLQLREALVSSGHLDQIVAMRDDFEAPMLPSTVVGLDVSPFFRSVLVDRGSRHGVQAGNPVITHEGVVGVVTRTSAHAAKTMLVLDRQSAVDAVVQRSRTRGTVRGRGTGWPEFEFEARGGDVQVGDLLLTSGLGGVYPKGLRLGEVTELSESGGGLFRLAVISPGVDFGRLEQVFVMLRRGPGMDLLYEAGEFLDPVEAQERVGASEKELRGGEG